MKNLRRYGAGALLAAVGLLATACGGLGATSATSGPSGPVPELDPNQQVDITFESYNLTTPSWAKTICEGHAHPGPEPRDRVDAEVMSTLGLENVTPQRHLALAGTYNVRDVGGYPTNSGGIIRPRTLIRADALHRLDEAGLAAIADLGVRTVVDLREAGERAAAPDPFPGPMPENRWLPVFQGRIKLGGQVPLERIYEHMVDDFGDGLTTAVRELARPGALPAIVHCSAGKDRTGVVVALALSVAGVAPEVIAEDYALTSCYLGEEFLADIERRMADLGLSHQPMRDHAIACPPELILSTLERISARHGSVTDFLLAHGATAQELAALRTALVHEPEE